MELICEDECRGIPFKYVAEAVNYMPYASAERVMFQMLAITGCRISELDNMQVNRIIKGWIYWKLAKNQASYRKEQLPEFYLKELNVYREKNRVYANKLFGISHTTFIRYFNRDVRPKLSQHWVKQRLKPCTANFQLEYIFQLKGLRKNFQTLEFARQLDKWKDSGVAIEMTSKKMRHSSKGITAYHYIESFDALEIEHYKKYSPAEILQQQSQTSLLNFLTGS
jgi:integrase